MFFWNSLPFSMIQLYQHLCQKSFVELLILSARHTCNFLQIYIKFKIVLKDHLLNN